MSQTPISGQKVTLRYILLCCYFSVAKWLHYFVLPLSPLFARFIPFSGGPRKCVGDQFALLEAIVALAIVIQKMDIQLVADQKISMTTGATIHTTNVRKHYPITSVSCA